MNKFVSCATLAFILLTVVANLCISFALLYLESEIHILKQDLVQLKETKEKP